MSAAEKEKKQNKTNPQQPKTTPGKLFKVKSLFASVTDF